MKCHNCNVKTCVNCSTTAKIEFNNSEIREYIFCSNCISSFFSLHWKTEEQMFYEQIERFKRGG